MSKKLGKIVSLAISVLVIATSFIGCGSKETTDSATTTAVSTEATTTTVNADTGIPKEFITLKVLYPGDQSKRMADFLGNEFKTKLKEELNTGVEVSWSPWDQYWNKKDMMIAAGEQIDWFWDGTPNLSKVVGSKSNQPIDELLNKYGQDLLKAIPADNFKALSIGGKIMGIPSQNAPTAEKLRSILVRQDILTEVGMTEIKTIADITKFGDLLKTKKPDMKLISADLFMALTRELDPSNITYDANNFITVNEDTKKASFSAMTEGWKLAAKQAKAWSEAGFTPEEVSIKPRELINRMKSGKYAVGEGAISRPLEDINDTRKNDPKAVMQEYLLASEKTKYRSMASTETIFIGITAKYPERAMQMLNWMFKDQEHYLFSLYGVADKDYKIENGIIKTINQDALWYEWMFRNQNYMVFPDTVSQEFVDTFKNWDKDAKLSCHFGFAFDPTSVNVQEAQLNQIVLEKLNPISSGFVDYDKAWTAAASALKSAGVEAYVAEYQKQLDAFIAGK